VRIAPYVGIVPPEQEAVADSGPPPQARGVTASVTRDPVMAPPPTVAPTQTPRPAAPRPAATPSPATATPAPAPTPTPAAPAPTPAPPQ
jgi:hypothetical protein